MSAGQARRGAAGSAPPAAGRASAATAGLAVGQCRPRSATRAEPPLRRQALPASLRVRIQHAVSSRTVLRVQRRSARLPGKARISFSKLRKIQVQDVSASELADLSLCCGIVGTQVSSWPPHPLLTSARTNKFSYVMAKQVCRGRCKPVRNTCVRTVKRCNKKNRHAPRGTIDNTIQYNKISLKRQATPTLSTAALLTPLAAALCWIRALRRKRRSASEPLQDATSRRSRRGGGTHNKGNAMPKRTCVATKRHSGGLVRNLPSWRSETVASDPVREREPSVYI